MNAVQRRSERREDLGWLEKREGGWYIKRRVEG